MKSEAEFWNVIKDYNLNTFSYQIVLIVLGIILTLLIYLKPSKTIQILMKIYLTFVFGWMAIVFFFLGDNSELSIFFSGPLFILLSILTGLTIGNSHVEISFPQKKWQKIITIIFLISVLAYPLISFLLGHRYPMISTPMMPCPISIFALVLLWGSDPAKITEKLQKGNRIIIWALIIGLTIWALMGFPKMFGLFNVKEDTILFFSGVYSILMIIRMIINKNKK
jgi:hypothetical protein